MATTIYPGINQFPAFFDWDGRPMVLTGPLELPLRLAADDRWQRSDDPTWRHVADRIGRQEFEESVREAGTEWPAGVLAVARGCHASLGQYGEPESDSDGSSGQAGS
jgi:hypothetical protein